MISLDGFLRLGRITPVSPMLHPTEITPAFTATATNTYQNHSKPSTGGQSINMIFKIQIIDSIKGCFNEYLPAKKFDLMSYN